MFRLGSWLSVVRRQSVSADLDGQTSAKAFCSVGDELAYNVGGQLTLLLIDRSFSLGWTYNKGAISHFNISFGFVLY